MILSNAAQSAGTQRDEKNSFSWKFDFILKPHRCECCWWIRHFIRIKFSIFARFDKPSFAPKTQQKCKTNTKILYTKYQTIFDRFLYEKKMFTLCTIDEQNNVQTFKQFEITFQTKSYGKLCKTEFLQLLQKKIVCSTRNILFSEIHSNTLLVNAKCKQA